MLGRKALRRPAAASGTRRPSATSLSAPRRADHAPRINRRGSLGLPSPSCLVSLGRPGLATVAGGHWGLARCCAEGNTRDAIEAIEPKGRQLVLCCRGINPLASNAGRTYQPEALRKDRLQDGFRGRRDHPGGAYGEIWGPFRGMGPFLLSARARFQVPSVKARCC